MIKNSKLTIKSLSAELADKNKSIAELDKEIQSKKIDLQNVQEQYEEIIDVVYNTSDNFMTLISAIMEGLVILRNPFTILMNLGRLKEIWNEARVATKEIVNTFRNKHKGFAGTQLLSNKVFIKADEL